MIDTIRSPAKRINSRLPSLDYYLWGIMVRYIVIVVLHQCSLMTDCVSIAHSQIVKDRSGFDFIDIQFFNGKCSCELECRVLKVSGCPSLRPVLTVAWLELGTPSCHGHG